MGLFVKSFCILYDINGIVWTCLTKMKGFLHA
jgi:hypothetical protein